MSDDLTNLFGELTEQVATACAQPEATYQFSAESLPIPPAQMTTPHLYIERGVHDYEDCFRVDMVTFYAGKQAYLHLALLILAVVLHPEPVAARIELTHPASEVKILNVASEGQPVDRWLGHFHTRPVSFTYRPTAIERIPWYDLPLGPNDFPCLCLRSDMSRKYPTEEDRWRERDVVVGFGNERGCVRLAELLLNASRPESAVTEIVLESEAGYRGVGRRSAEARFELPGSMIWDRSQWPGS